jgi:hypothetical protein
LRTIYNPGGLLELPRQFEICRVSGEGFHFTAPHFRAEFSESTGIWKNKSPYPNPALSDGELGFPLLRILPIRKFDDCALLLLHIRCHFSRPVV